jgi:hypothetical protein
VDARRTLIERKRLVSISSYKRIFEKKGKIIRKRTGRTGVVPCQT